MRYGSLCSGIEAATVAWHPLGWSPAFFAEVERFPSQVLAHHYGSNMPGEALPTNGVPNLGDITRFKEWPDAAIDVLVGGTPCQSFSVAGLRKGLADPRGNLALTYLAIADRYRPEWLVWENVPGVLSSGDGRDFGAFLGGLGELGYGFAYRVLDAQYVRVDGFGRAVPQRRRRVFVVGNSRDWRRAAAVLLEPESLSGNPAPRREAGKSVAGTLKACAGKSGQPNGAEEADRLVVAHALRGEGFDASEDGTGRGTPLIPIDMRQASRGATMTNNRPIGSSGGAPGTGIGEDGDPSPTIASSHVPAVAFVHQAGGDQTTLGWDPEAGTAPTLGACQTPALQQGWAVRRLMPVECERLQGFPDGYTDIKDTTPDGPRYKALGNSMAVNVMRWIGTRIEMVQQLADEIDKARAA